MTPDIKRYWNAGNKGCGRLACGLRRELAALNSGEHLAVQAEDVGASRDIPSWCRITGHTLIASIHPVYVIQKKGDQHV